MDLQMDNGVKCGCRCISFETNTPIITYQYPNGTT